MKRKDRLKILSDDEITEIYELPSFDKGERNTFFEITPNEGGLLERFRTTRTKVYFILQLGYFRAKKRFFVFNSQEVLEDSQFILEKYFPEESDTANEITITKPTRLTQQEIILKLYSCSRCTKKVKGELGKKARKLATICFCSVYIFKELIVYLDNNGFLVPGYTFMQDLIGGALTYEENRLEKTAGTQIPQDIKNSLDNLLTTRNTFYELTKIKKEPKGFNYQEINRVW